MNRLLSTLFLSLPASCLYASGPLADHFDDDENKRILALLTASSNSGLVSSRGPRSFSQVNLRDGEPSSYVDYATMMDLFLKKEVHNAELFLKEHKNDPIGEGDKVRPLPVVRYRRLRAFFGCFWLHA